ncbi:hypothetical protein O9992_19020 [Vibrio lentus]|nr:hypothetical protein [Vibrio lentus]
MLEAAANLSHHVVGVAISHSSSVVGVFRSESHDTAWITFSFNLLLHVSKVQLER